jgi:ribulose-phosphate 3-epimerase
MITEPIRYVDAFCKAGADTLTVHAEACADVPSVLKAIRSQGVRTGVTVNPDIAIDRFLPWLEDLDQVLIMTVYAGFGGQKFIPAMLDKIKAVRQEALRRKPQLDIQVDGGIDNTTAGPCAAAGANMFVAGSYIFGAPNYKQRIDALREAIQSASNP